MRELPDLDLSSADMARAHSKIRIAPVVALAALALCAGSSSAAPGGRRPSSAPIVKQLTITVPDGTRLTCGLVVPAGRAPAGGWPGLVLFHALGSSHLAMQAIAAKYFAPSGLASLACDARGTGGSGGAFDLDGPVETQDTRYLFNGFASLSVVSNTKIGAFGWSLGGGGVWNAAVAGVPFKALAVGASWTNLAQALMPHGVPKNGRVERLARGIRASSWDPASLRALTDLSTGHVSPATNAAAALRSARAKLGSLDIPTLILQGRHDFLFDLGQAVASYGLLPGKKALYIGDFGHSPAKNPPAEQPFYYHEVAGWFAHYLAGGPPVPGGVALARDPWNGSAVRFKSLPATRTLSFRLPGKNKLVAARFVSRSVRLPDRSLQTFGSGWVIVHYAGAVGWTDRLVATVSLQGAAIPITEGAAPITAAGGSLRIPLLDEAVPLTRGKKLVVTIGTSSRNGEYRGTIPRDGINAPKPGGGRPITIGRIDLKLPVLKPVSGG